MTVNHGNMGYSNFFRFWAATRISRVICAEMVGDKTRELAYEMFRLNVDFIGPRPDSVCSRRPAHAGVKEGYLSKSGYLFHRCLKTFICK